MQGAITRVQVFLHPVVIIQSFGLKVLVRALFANTRATFLEVVTRCAEEEAHLKMAEFDLAHTVKRFIDFECRVRDLYRRMSKQLAGAAEVAEFFTTLSGHEEGHATFLSRVRREIGKGRLWKQSKDVHAATVQAFQARLAAYEAEVVRGVSLARALEIVEGIEGSELNVVFDTLSGSVDMRSRSRFERFFVLTQRHLAYCRERIDELRLEHGITPSRAV